MNRMKTFVNRVKIDKIREVCGTLPSRKMKKVSNIFFGCEALKIDVLDYPHNPYRAIFSMATATWGNDKYEDKWKVTSPFNRYKVVLYALRGKSLPISLESPKYTFRVVGLPRHCFDQMARTRIGAGFGSIGSRDNCKLDSSFILYSEYKTMSSEFLANVKAHIDSIKEIYEYVITRGCESWQTARSFLPLCYHHPFHFTQNLLSLIMQMRRRMCFGEEEFICGLHWALRRKFQDMGCRLIADAMRPACDFAKRCLYSQGDGSELFGNLFAGCGRWPSYGENKEYREFNKSCSNKDSLEGQLGFNIPPPSEYDEFTADEIGFEKIRPLDELLYFLE